MSITNKYFNEMKDAKLLTAEEEISLSTILNSDVASAKEKQSAREILAEKNFRLVAKIAYKYAEKTRADVDDLISEGYHGLMRAIDKYNYDEYGTKFSTFAVSWITQGITHFLYKSSFINIPSSIMDKAKKMKMLMEGGINNESEIARILGVNEAEIVNMKMALVSKIDLDEPVVNKDGQVASFSDIIEDTNVVAANEAMSKKEISHNLMSAVAGLDEIQRDIISQRWLDGEKVNLSDLGKKYGMTGENVRLIEKKAFDILRTKMKDMA
jgi:RNA polymerase sigma factor (sigma-70 family)